MRKCTECGTEFSDSAKFCPECGKKYEVQEQVKTVSLHCKDCNGTLTVDAERNILACPYCGSSQLIIDSDTVAAEKIKQEAYKEVEEGKRQIEREKLEHELKMVKVKSEVGILSSIKRTLANVAVFMGILLGALLCGGICLGEEPMSEKAVSAIFAGIMTVMFAAAWIVGLGDVKNRKMLRAVFIILALLMFILCMIFAPVEE